MKLVKTQKFTVLSANSVTGQNMDLETIANSEGWNAAAPVSFVSSVLASRKQETEEDVDWILVERPAPSNEEETAAPLRTFNDWAEFVDPESGCTYWFNAQTKVSSWEPPPETISSSLDADSDSLKLEMQYLREAQQKLVKVVAAMHQRITLNEEKEKEKEEDIKRLAISIDDIESRTPRIKLGARKQFPDKVISSRIAPPTNRAAFTSKALDKALAAAMRAEDLRLFKR